MIENIVLPEDLNTDIGSENKDFAVQAAHAQPLKKSLSSIFSGVAMLAFCSIFVFPILSTILQGKEVHFTANGVPTVAGPGNLSPLITPALIIGIFVLIGIGILIFGIYSLFKKGGYFVGTPTRLIHYQKNSLKSLDWNEFSGNMEITGNAQKGNITLQMKTGKIVSQKNRPDKYVPDMVYISGITDVFEIEQICRKRIQEHNPNPPVAPAPPIMGQSII